MPTAFDRYVEHTVRVSRTCLICVARNRYSVRVSESASGSAAVYPPRIVVIVDDTMIASHERLFDRDQVSFDWQLHPTHRMQNRCAAQWGAVC